MAESNIASPNFTIQFLVKKIRIDSYFTTTLTETQSPLVQKQEFPEKIFNSFFFKPLMRKVESFFKTFKLGVKVRIS